jgi:hypothetical protein
MIESSLLNTGSLLMAFALITLVAFMAVTGRLPQKDSNTVQRIKELEAIVDRLMADHVRDANEITALQQQLAVAVERIRFLEATVTRREEKAGPERVLLAVVGSDPELRADLAALREVENECGLLVTRCLPAKFTRFAAIMNRYRADRRPIQCLHFSVHASAEGTPAVLFEDGPITGEQLSGVMNGVQVAMIAGCDSDLVGDLLGVVPAVVTFREPIRHDYAALAAKIFWLGIGCGVTPREAYRDCRARLPAEVAEFLEFHG